MASIRERRRNDGSAYYSVLWREGGRQTSISVSDHRDAQHIKAVLDLTGALPASLSAPAQRLSVVELVERHIAALTGVERRTEQGYQAMLRLHISPAFADVEAAEVTREAVARWVNSLAKRRSAKTTRNVHALLSAAYTFGVDEGLVSRNPARAIRMPRGGRDRLPVLIEREDYPRIAEHLPEQWRHFFDLLAASGARWSEIAALTPSDIDRARSTVSITKAIKRIDGGANVVGPTKTRKSRRVVSIAAEYLEALKPRLLRGQDELIFADLLGKGLSSRPAHHAWGKAVVASGIRYPVAPTVKDLRASHISWLLAAGTNPKVAQDRVGHESLRTTMEIYALVQRGADEDAANLLGGLAAR